MKLEEYNVIVKTIRNYRKNSVDCGKMLISKFSSYHPKTLYAILSLEMYNKMKMLHYKVFGTDTDFYGRYLMIVKEQEQSQNKTDILLQIAEKLEVCPTLLARKVLEQYCTLENYDHNSMHKKDVNKLLRDTTLIKDRNLAYNVYKCVLYDDQYGPIATSVDESVGEEYEFTLEKYLKEYNIPYYNEHSLRAKGYDKTPDFKLEVPIAVDGFVVNWIESKAQFGSILNHKKYIKDQYLSYWNRFGPGLVIYWFDYVDDIATLNDGKFIVMNHFPEHITYMDPNSLK